MRSSTQPPAPQHVSGALGVQIRVNPEPVSAKPAPTRFRRARAVLDLCHGDPWLSAPIRRRGAHVAPQPRSGHCPFDALMDFCSADSHLIGSPLVSAR